MMGLFLNILLKNNNNIIILWTARGWEQYRMTKTWLEQHGFVYDQLVMGKPIVDLMIDDRAKQFCGDWTKQDV